MYEYLLARVKKAFCSSTGEEHILSAQVQQSPWSVNDPQVVRAEEIVRCLTREPSSDCPPVYTCRDKRIEGSLDLKYRTIGTAVDIQDCEFLDSVDLRYCEFTQAINLSGCTFHKEVNSGDIDESYTIFRKDLICNAATFKRLV